MLHLPPTLNVVRAPLRVAANLLLIIFLAAPAFGQEPARPDLEKRVRDLEELVQKLQAQIEATRTVPPSTATSTLIAASRIEAQTPSPIPAETTGWKNGFIIQAPDNGFSLKLTGQIQSDFRGFVNPRDTTDIDSFLVRRARLGVEATVFQYFEFRFLPDFGLGKTVIQDSFMNINYWEQFQFQIGKFKQPVSYEQLIQDRFVPTMERSLIDQVMPARDVGAMLHGEKLFGDRLDYAAGFFNGSVNGDQDTNNRLDFAARVAVRPFNFDAFPGCLHLLQLGVSGSTGTENENISPATLRTPATVPWFAFKPGVVANGLRTRLTPEVSYFNGPFGFATQFIAMDQAMRPSTTATSVNVPFDGYYILATYLVTGERRTTYSAGVEPIRPFNPLNPFGEPGAWELVVRHSRLHVGDVVFANGLVDPTRYANSASEFTVGFNWYLNALVRTQFNWEHAVFNHPVRLGPAGLLNGQETLYARLQIIF